MSQLDGKVAVLTGAGGGIGSKVAAMLAARGARVTLADLSLDAAQASAGTIGAPESSLPFQVDIADPDAVEAMIAATLARFGRLDILINNAADLSADRGPRDRDIETMDLDVWDRAFQVNVRGTMLCCRGALPHMVSQGGGSIVNVASNLALQGNVVQAAYSASKAAVVQLTRSIAASHGRRGVRCNTVSPGMTLTPGLAANLPAAHRAAVEAETLTPYLGEPADIAAAIAFLASDEARYITGQNLVVDGGTASHVPGFERLTALGRPSRDAS